MKFHEALSLINKGHLITSPSIGEDAFIYMVAGSQFTVSRPPLNALFKEGTVVNYAPHIDICHLTEGGIYCAVWKPSQIDLSATDFEEYTGSPSIIR